MSTTLSHSPDRQIVRSASRTSSSRRRPVVRPDISRPTYVMGPANRAPGIPVMGTSDPRFVDALFTGGPAR